MHLPTVLPLFLIPFAAAIPSSAPQHVFSNPPAASRASLRIPTVHDSAVQARRILHLSSIATFSTVFPASSSSGGPAHGTENRPDDVGGAPIGLMEYYASCAPRPYDPTFLAVNIATPIKNAAAGSNVTLSLRYHPPADAPPSDDMYTYSPANLPRFSLVGHIEAISAQELKDHNVSACYLEKHEDAVLWTPGNDIHTSWWGRLVVEEVYFFGGFGDRAYIGWIPVDEWRGVTEKEVNECRLVGEKAFEKEEL